MTGQFKHITNLEDVKRFVGHLLPHSLGGHLFLNTIYNLALENGLLPYKPCCAKKFQKALVIVIPTRQNSRNSREFCEFPIQNSRRSRGIHVVCQVGTERKMRGHTYASFGMTPTL